FFDRPAFKDDTSKIDQQGHARVAQHVEERGITLLKNNGVLPLDASRLHSIAVIGSPANSYVRGGGSSEVSPFFFVTPRDGIARRAGPRVKVNYDDGGDPATAAATASSSDVAVVFVRDADTEGADRACMSLDCPNVETPTSQNLQYAPPGQNELIQQVATANP